MFSAITSLHRPLSQGNRLQRAYARWAAPHYLRVEPPARERLELIDRWLMSRHGLLFWLGVTAVMAGCSLGLRHVGLPWWISVPCGVLLGLWLPLLALSVWWLPGHFMGPQGRRLVYRWMPVVVLAGLLGFATGHLARHGWIGPQALAMRLWDASGGLAALVLLIAATVLGLVRVTAGIREQVLQRQLAQARLQQERDAARSEAVQAQLSLLQAQIQPHFIFNTLSALQHWVDGGDPRAGPLLRSLSAFLRGSTELLTRPHARLDEEAALVTHYLHVMASRLGKRLHWQVDIDPALHGVLLPPGLLLTLVENAIEHGASQSLHGASVVLSAEALAGRLRLCVKDSAGRWQAGTPDGVGLRNTRQRLLHRHGASASLTLQLHEGCTLAVIDLPLDAPTDAPTRESASLPPAAP